MSALSYLLSMVAPMVKVPSVLSTLAGTFSVAGWVTLDLLPVELSGKSSMGVQHSEMVRFLEALLDVLPGFWLFFCLAGAVVAYAAVGIAAVEVIAPSVPRLPHGHQFEQQAQLAGATRVPPTGICLHQQTRSSSG
jgi:hypothetical protein